MRLLSLGIGLLSGIAVGGALPTEASDLSNNALKPRILNSHADFDAPFSGNAQVDDFLRSDASVLSIMYPDGKRKNLMHSDALFGIPIFGGSITGRLYYPKGEGLNLGCADLNQDVNIPSDSIFLLDRGNCTFTTKVLNAQKAGAIGVVVVDSFGLCGINPECDEKACTGCPAFTADKKCACSLPFLADDGFGSQVTIPSAIVPKMDGDELKKYATAGKDEVALIAATFRWSIPVSDKKVTWELWGDPSEKSATTLLDGMKTYVPYLSKKNSEGAVIGGVFTPHFSLIDGIASGCGGIYNCANQCTNHGRYCHVDPDGDLDSGVSGADVVEETLRQICIWSQVQGNPAVPPSAEEKDGPPTELAFFQYSHAFATECAPNPSTFNAKCSTKQQIAAGLNPTETRKCVAASNARSDEVHPADGKKGFNPLLEAEIRDKRSRNVRVMPTTIVNDRAIPGAVEPVVLMRALCAGFGIGQAPRVCQCLHVPKSHFERCVSGVDPDTSGNNVNKKKFPSWLGAVIGIMGVVGLIGGAVLVALRRQQRYMDRMREEYLSLAGGPSEAQGGRQEIDDSRIDLGGVPLSESPSQLGKNRRTPQKLTSFFPKSGAKATVSSSYPNGL